jgi:MFS transporter, DHA2 family, multidrug resistance protein
MTAAAGPAAGQTVATAAAAAAPRATRREWIGLAVLTLPCLLYSMDLTVLNLAVPKLSADLRPSSAQLLWITDVYGFLLAGSLITMGTLGDRIGRRRLLLIGSAAFGIASVLAAFAPTAPLLIAARALLGLAGATLAPSTLSLLRAMFHDPGQRATAISVWITGYSAGAVAGPLLGGVLLQWFWWGSVFLLAVPVMALLLVVGPRLLPEFRDPEPGRLDLSSAALSMAAVLSLIFGLKQAVQSGAGWGSLSPAAIGIALAIVFVRRQRRLADPLLDLRLFRIPGFGAALATYTAGVLVVFGADLFAAQYLQLVLGLSPLQAGLWLAPSASGFIVGSMLAPPLARRVRPAAVMAAGLVLAAGGFVLLTRVEPTAGLVALVVGSTVFAIGVAPAVTLSTDLVVGAAPPERAGAAAGISETGAELGGALGIAVLGSIGTAVYRGQVARAVPAGLPAHVTDAARDTLGGAVAAAGQLPDRIGAPLLAATRVAFTHGLQVAAGISALVALGAAVMVGILLRRVPVASASEPATDAAAADGGALDRAAPDATTAPAVAPAGAGLDQAARAAAGTPAVAPAEALDATPDTAARAVEEATRTAATLHLDVVTPATEAVAAGEIAA